MISGQNIICFANDWHNDPTSKHQVMKLLSRENRVLWVNSIGMRKPSASGADLKRVVLKLIECLRGLEKINDNLYVFTPIVLSLPSSSLARQINALLLRISLWYYRNKLKMKNFQLWTFVPTMVELAGKMGEKLLLYYCVDEWSKFSFMDGAKLRQMEIDLMKKSDLVIVTADCLLRDKINYNDNTHLISHGVDYDHFSRTNKEYSIPKDIKDIKGPILGFFGLIHEWIDLELIEKVAQKRPDWSLVLIGKVSVDVSRLKSFDNVFLLGQKSYDHLPAYCETFDIGLIPFAVNELTINVNPIKLREYLSAGLPVVSTRLPEVEKYSELVQIADSYEEFISKIEYCLENDSVQKRAGRQLKMKFETWDSKVNLISKHVEDTIDKQRLGQNPYAAQI